MGRPPSHSRTLQNSGSRQEPPPLPRAGQGDKMLIKRLLVHYPSRFSKVNSPFHQSDQQSLALGGTCTGVF